MRLAKDALAGATVPCLNPVMENDLFVRRAEPSDAKHIGALVRRTLRISNAADYSNETIERVAANFTAEYVEALMRTRTVVVALWDQKIVGTASLEQDNCRTVFVAPEMQQRGVGRQLMKKIETVAQHAGYAAVQVPSSLTAVGFYEQLGFEAVGEAYHGDEKTILMKKDIDRT